MSLILYPLEDLLFHSPLRPKGWLKDSSFATFCLKRIVLQTSHLGYFDKAQEWRLGRDEVGREEGSRERHGSWVWVQVEHERAAGVLLRSRCSQTHAVVHSPGMGLGRPGPLPAPSLISPIILEKLHDPVVSSFLSSKMMLEQTSSKVFSSYEMPLLPTHQL